MPAAPSPPSQLDVLLNYVKSSRGFDFTGYKRTTLERRLAKRMDEVGLGRYDDYRDHLEANADEFERLFNTILINVTSFFRDPQVWEHVAAVTIPSLLEAVGDDAPIRVWCAGCSTGEETYTVAILLAEALGIEAYCTRVKIYATDVDDEALAEARAAVYSDKAIETLPPGILERYFEPHDRRHALRKDLRRSVIFGRNDLVQDAPISRIDLLTCRNTLMYFNAETQGRILARFSFALNDAGTLLLGKSEMLITHSDLFEPEDLKRRLFRRAARTRVPEILVAPTVASSPEAQGDDVLERAFDAAPTAQVVVDEAQRVVAVNGRARALFGVGPGDLGRPLRDLELSYRPVDLRTTLERIARDLLAVTLGPVKHESRDGKTRMLEVLVSPIDTSGRARGATIAFSDVTVQRELRHELETSKAELENAYEELQSTVEELETTNEELQSTNEELETTNEEVQSTNEELETTNEELQSTNEELEAMNEEFRARTSELHDVNGFLETILATLETAVVVVDGQLVVQLWNGQAEELFGLRLQDVQHRGLLSLDIGLPVRELADPLGGVLRGAVPKDVVALEAMNRRGRAFTSRVTILPLDAAGDSTYGALLLITVVDPGERPAPPAGDAIG